MPYFMISLYNESKSGVSIDYWGTSISKPKSSGKILLIAMLSALRFNGTTDMKLF